MGKLDANIPKTLDSSWKLRILRPFPAS